MAVTVERASIGSIIGAGRVGNSDVGVEAGIHIVLTLGIFYLFLERGPVVFVVDGEVVVLHLVLVIDVDGRGAAVHIQLNIILHAGAAEVNNLVALLAILITQLYILLLHHFAGGVLRGDVECHLSTVVPHSAHLVDIVPRHADAVVTLIFPLG